MITLSGERISKMVEDLANADSPSVAIFPQPGASEIKISASYRIGISNKLIRNLTRDLRWAPDDVRLEAIQLYDALIKESF